MRRLSRRMLGGKRRSRGGRGRTMRGGVDWAAVSQVDGETLEAKRKDIAIALKHLGTAGTAVPGLTAARTAVPPPPPPSATAARNGNFAGSGGGRRRYRRTHRKKHRKSKKRTHRRRKH